VSHLEGLLKFSRASTTVAARKEHTFKASNYDELKDAVERICALLLGWHNRGGASGRNQGHHSRHSTGATRSIWKCILTGKDTARRSFSHVPIDSKYCQSELAG